MSPFSEFLHTIRVRHGLRQADLARRIGYEQSYISALEVGLKGPPTDEFAERLAVALELTGEEQTKLRAAVRASQRKLVIDADTPTDVYWLLQDLRDEIQDLSPAQVRAIREVIAIRKPAHEAREFTRRIRRRFNEEVSM